MVHRGHGGAGRPKQKPLNAPFLGLKKRLQALAPPSPRRERRLAVASAPPPADEPALFAQAMEGVVRLPRTPHSERIDGPRPAGIPRRPVSEEAEALAALSDLVGGSAHFDITETREYVEGMVVGLDPRLVRRLRRGDFAWQSYVDLHGMTAAEARETVSRFLDAAVRGGLRCVLIVHGRGLNSKDRAPVLKERLKSWLSRGANARLVLAFATARSVDGGAGAVYVLLRRDRRRRPIQVTEGTAR
jgi:DNA-nicking Smr family endonuclease